MYQVAESMGMKAFIATAVKSFNAEKIISLVCAKKACFGHIYTGVPRHQRIGVLKGSGIREVISRVELDNPVLEMFCKICFSGNHIIVINTNKYFWPGAAGTAAGVYKLWQHIVGSAGQDVV